MHRTALLTALLWSAAAVGLAAPADRARSLDGSDPLRAGADQPAAVQVADGIHMVYGFGNTFMITTPDGNVIIDTSMADRAPRARELLTAVSREPVRYVVLTHGHGDHTGGLSTWLEPGTQVVAQQAFADFLHYQTRLAGFFGRRNAAQFGLPAPPAAPWAGNYGATVPATILFGTDYAFELGGRRFELLHTPGETPDHLTLWLPQQRAAFIGDNYYESFPNLYTLRGTQPRWALDYVASLDRILELAPEIVLPSHGAPIVGNAAVTKALTQYRDAILFVHDAVVAGMNAGKSVYTLMQEIRLPPALEVGEGYGNLIWSIRGIYEGYAGWFDGNPATMYAEPPASVHAELVSLAGGPDAVAARASRHVEAGEHLQALHMADVALAADAAHRPALEVRRSALRALHARSINSNERGWLEHGIRDATTRLEPRE
jgi:alkyl sulfatase BDS1-like metallo-beta-lactamase superfamily hydrolase